MAPEGTVEYKENLFKAKVREIKIFLEIEIFNFNLENEKEIEGFVGNGDSFEKFKEEAKIPRTTGQIKEGWKPIEQNQIFQADFKSDWLEKTIRIQAKRKNVAFYYDDGERGWNRTDKIGKKIGKWPDDVKIIQSSDPLPTEEILVRIFRYPKNDESTYKEKKKEKTIPLLSKIVILQKEGELEYVIDHFVSL